MANQLADLPPELAIEAMMLARQRERLPRVTGWLTNKLHGGKHEALDKQEADLSQRYQQGFDAEAAKYNQIRTGTPGQVPDSGVAFEEIGGTPGDPQAAVAMALASRFPAVRRMGTPHNLGKSSVLPTGETVGTDKAWEEERRLAMQTQRDNRLAGLRSAEQIAEQNYLLRAQAIAQQGDTAQARAAAAEAEANYRRELLRLREEGAAARNLPRAKAGYTWNADGSEQVLIKGGPEYNKMVAAQAKDKAFLDDVTRNFEDTIRIIDQLVGKEDSKGAEGKPHTGLTAGTGLPGVVMRRIPGKLSMGAKDFAALLETLNAKVSFAELGRMRRESPTGGALGQIAVRELQLLEQSLRPTDPNQSEPALLKHLTDMRRLLRDSVANLQKGYGDGYKALESAQGFSAPGRAAPKGPSLDDLLKTYGGTGG